MNPSSLGKINFVELADSFVTGLFVALVTYLYGVVQAPGFDIFTFHWVTLVNFLVVTVVVVIKNMLTTSNGLFVGAVKVK
jgi:hypothetical protein